MFQFQVMFCTIHKFQKYIIIWILVMKYDFLNFAMRIEALSLPWISSYTLLSNDIPFSLSELENERETNESLRMRDSRTGNEAKKAENIFAVICAILMDLAKLFNSIFFKSYGKFIFLLPFFFFYVHVSQLIATELFLNDIMAFSCFHFMLCRIILIGNQMDTSW